MAQNPQFYIPLTLHACLQTTPVKNRQSFEIPDSRQDTSKTITASSVDGDLAAREISAISNLDLNAATSGCIDIDKNARAFLHIIYGLAFVRHTSLGRDLTVTTIDAMHCVEVKDTHYEIPDMHRIGHTVCGRSTIYSYVKSPESVKKYIVKDSWIDDSCAEKEWQLLERGKYIDGIGHSMAHWNVVADGKPDTAEAIRTRMQISEIRQHQKECALPLHQFETLREFASVFIDVIEGDYVLHCRARVLTRILLVAHQAMFDKKGILHRDISFQNIMIRSERDEPPGKRRGLLIDFDYGATILGVPESSDSVKAHRSVSHRLRSERRQLLSGTP
jgi:hypothetical protein